MRICAYASALLVAALTLTATFAPRSPLLDLAERLPGADATAHFLLLGVTAFAMTLAFTRPAPRLRWARLGPASLLLLAATAEELSQLAIRGRTFSLGDLAANGGGIAFFTALALAWQWTRRPSDHLAAGGAKTPS
jgi:hypothetical protein